jgi:hypothetical protein
MCTSKGVRAKKSGKRVSWEWNQNLNVTAALLPDWLVRTHSQRHALRL